MVATEYRQIESGIKHHHERAARTKSQEIQTRESAQPASKKVSKQAGASTQKLRAQAHLSTRLARYSYKSYKGGYPTANRITWQLSSCRMCACQARHLISRRKQNKMWIGSLFPRQLGLNMRGNPIVLISEAHAKTWKG